MFQRRATRYLFTLSKELVSAQKRLGLPVHNRKSLGGLEDHEKYEYASIVLEEVALLCLHIVEKLPEVDDDTGKEYMAINARLKHLVKEMRKKLK